MRRSSLAPRLDPLFEFDAPQSFIDLSAAPSAVPSTTHDPWFNQVHPEHSKSSAELARELAETLKRLEEKSRRQEKRKERPSVGKENRRPSDDWRDLLLARNKEIQSQKKRKFQSLKEARRLHEPFQTAKKGLEKQKQVQGSHKRLRGSDRVPLKERVQGNVENKGRGEEVEGKQGKARGGAVKGLKRGADVKNLQELLARHNKKLKVVHTYEPPQHSVREVKQWERETKKSYYALSAEERVHANEEIKIWKQRRAIETSH